MGQSSCTIRFIYQLLQVFFSVYLKCKNNKNWFLHILLLKILLNGINYRIQVREYFCIIQYDEQKILNNQNQQNKYQKLYNYGFATVTLFSTNEWQKYAKIFILLGSWLVEQIENIRPAASNIK